ncbi:hypothetical protein EIK77_009395 [Talaromyces pinophilus]|nr:hypothetical protein EIK77_009395 [Talaromyces pinophilus]PCH07486.1 Hypothetical protein PENO1_011710 [Penicillium occitanis (nom. inval.)]PCH09270.1 hypothetical protein PENOC_010540 [Penicillium occitanis (nom. inval.)]
MPPIRTFKSAPINANTPTSTSEAQEPQQEQYKDAVAGETTGNEGGPAWAPATPTAATPSIGDSNYPAARPGAPAMPAPTSPFSTSGNVYTPTRTYPTSTASTDATSSPPAPQPGSRPAPPPPSSSTSSTSPSPNRATGKGAVPPPPKVGEPVQPASYYAPSFQQKQQQQQQQQQQQTIPNSTSTPYLSTYRSPASYGSTYVAGSAPGLPLSQVEQSSRSIFDGTLGEGTTGQDILNTAKSWMASAGNKLAEAEEEVWRMVNKKT